MHKAGTKVDLSKNIPVLTKVNFLIFKLKFLVFAHTLGVTEGYLTGDDPPPLDVENARNKFQYVTSRKSSSSSTKQDEDDIENKNEDQEEQARLTQAAEEFKAAEMVVYSVLIQHMDDSLLHLIQHVPLGDAAGAWQQIKQFFQTNTRNDRRAKKLDSTK